MEKRNNIYRHRKETWKVIEEKNFKIVKTILEKQKKDMVKWKEGGKKRKRMSSYKQCSSNLKKMDLNLKERSHKI